MSNLIYRLANPGTGPAADAVSATPLTVLQVNENFYGLNADIQTRALRSGDTFTGNVVIAGSGSITLSTSGDITASRPGGTTGVIYLGSGSRYLYNDGANYNLVGQGLVLGGVLNATGVNLANPVGVASGGSGVTSLSGVVFGNAASVFTAATSAQLSTALGSTFVANANNATLFNGLSLSGTYNNSGSGHGAIASFSAITAYGQWFVHQDAVTDGPSSTPNQYYVTCTGLGAEYSYGQYANIVAKQRNSPYSIYTRTIEGGTLTAWVLEVNSSNYNTLVPNNNGAGAFGSWNINALTSSSTPRLSGPAFTNGADGWFRSTSNCGWYNETYAVGIYVPQSGYVGTYGGGGFISQGLLVANNGLTTTGPVTLSATTTTTLVSSGQTFDIYGNPAGATPYSWTGAATTTNSIEIVSGNVNSNHSPTLAFHSYGYGGPQFRLDNAGSGVLYLECSNANSARVGVAPGNYGYFSRLELTGGLSVTGQFNSTFGSAIFLGLQPGGIGDINAGYGGLQVRGNGGATAAYMAFHRPGSFAAYFGLDTDNQWKVGGWSYGATSSTLLLSSNFNSYAPTLTGVGASGSWNINIAGTANAVANGMYSNIPMTRISPTGGYLDGNYPYTDNGATSGCIYTIGNSYRPTATTLGTMYGVGYTVSNVGATSVAGVPGGNWGFYVASAGTSMIFLNANTGSGHFNGQLYAGNVQCVTNAGTWGISTTGNAATATTLSGDRTTWASQRTNAIANMLGWKNYGNGHVIFDASAGTSPDGSAVNNANPQNAWSATFPTLMGWNGGNTYGVRVDSARIADNSSLVAGLAVAVGVNNIANQIVRTDTNGYIQAGWINTPSGDVGANTLTKIYTSNDNYLRYNTPDTFKMLIGLSGKANGYTRTQYTSDANFHVGSLGNGPMGMNEVFHGGSAFIDTWSGTNFPPGTGHVHGVQALHYTANSLGTTGGTAYGMQLVTQYNQPGQLWTRGCVAGTFTSWRAILSDTNYNSYVPTLTGAGASGTWGINVTGSAGAAGYLTGPTHTNGIDGWFRSNGNCGWFNETWAIGIYATDATWVRTYGGAGLLVSGTGLNVTGDTTLNNALYVVGSTSTTGISNNGYLYMNSNYGHSLVGLYNPGVYQGIFAMGDAYKLTPGGGIGTLYGMCWSHPAAGGIAGNLDSHGMIVAIRGLFGSSMSYSIVASGNVTSYSDERLKTNWRDLPTNFVEQLADVKVGIYTRTDCEQVTQVGVSAQSLRKVMPNAVIEAKDDDKTLSVSYGNAALAACVMLAKEVQELKLEINKLKNKEKQTWLSKLKSIFMA